MSVALAKMLRAVQIFRALDAGMPLRLVAVFVAVSEEGGLGVTELARRLQIPSGSTSRAVAALSDRHWIKGKTGLGLLSTTQIGQMKRVDLTAKGRALAESLAAVLEDRKEKTNK